MTQYPQEPGQPARKRKIWIVLTVIGGLIVAGIAAAAVIVLPGPSTFTVTGSVAVEAGDAADPDLGGTCVTDGGYSDIRAGAQVTVKDAEGTVIGVGALDPGRTSDAAKLPKFNPETGQVGDALQATKCGFKFSVLEVPEGESFYSVEVSRRGEVRYEPGALTAGLELVVGG